MSLPSIFSLSPDSTEKLKDAESLIRASTAAGSSQQPELMLSSEEVEQELAAATLDLATISTSTTKTEVKTMLVETTQVIEKK